MGRGAKTTALTPGIAVDFAEGVIEQLLDRIAEGQPLSQICADSRMPGTSTVYRWLDEDEDFAGRFRARRAIGIHKMAEDCLFIADEPPEDAVQVADKRVRIDTRLRLAGKWLPSLYGDKLDVTSGGEKLGLSGELEAARKRILSAEGK